MENEKNDQILRCYSILNSLKQNIPNTYEVEDQWIFEFNNTIEKMEKTLEVNLSDFKVPQSKLVQSVATSNYMTGETTYRDGLWCERSILMHKLDAILTYFSVQSSSDGKNKIGFDH